jgi:putative ABC transport system permease protein
MTYSTLALAITFVFIPFVLSKVLKLNLEKDTLISAIRSVIQLLLLGYILQFVFDADSPIYIILMIFIMITAATLNARKKGKAIKGITWKLALTIGVVEIVTQSILLGFQIIPATPQYIIPISGMLIGNSMVLSILFLNRFQAEVEAHEAEIELILSLGGTPRQAIHNNLMQSIKTSMVPVIESQKTIGLVQIPGIMSGQIIGGADPVVAVQFQILINFALLTCATLSSIILGYLVYPTMFNEKMQRLKHSKMQQ